MDRLIFLNSSPLGQLSHPTRGAEIAAWVAEREAEGYEFVIAEIIDYEVRRELLRAGEVAGLNRLNLLKQTLLFEPVTSEAMLLAAQLWAQCRRQGRSTASQDALEVDVILAAQALLRGREGHDVVVATENSAHLSLFVAAKRWQEI